MKTWLYTATAAFALILTGLVQGYWTDRWLPDQATIEAATRLAEIPKRIGDWEGTDLELKPGQSGPGVTGCLQRSYTNRRLGVTVVMALVNGRPGPIATHTPEVCYGASGYMVGKRKPCPLELKDQTANFWTSDARRTRATEESNIRLFWAWNGGEGWTASEDARQEFPRFRYPVLHKLYVLRDLSTSTKSTFDPKDEPCIAFLEALLPVLDQNVTQQGS